MAKKKNQGNMEAGLGKDQISQATTTLGETEFASDLTLDNNTKAKSKKMKKNS